MALTVRRTEYIKPRKAGLTPLGVGIAAAAVVLVLAVAGVLLAAQAGKRADEKAAQPIANAIDYALTVSRQTAAALGSGNDAQRVRDTVSLIEKESDPLKQADAAQELLGDMLALAQGNQAAIDEINGAKNRIQLAVRDYKNR